MTRPTVISAATLKSWLDNPSIRKNLAIVDVRDEDRVGGHIRGSVNLPSSTFHSQIDRVPAKPQVVFHCQLSQQRGPSCAAAYVRHIAGTAAAGREVYVLERGFAGWAREYGKDESVTEGYCKEVYEW